MLRIVRNHYSSITGAVAGFALGLLTSKVSSLGTIAESFVIFISVALWVALLNPKIKRITERLYHKKSFDPDFYKWLEFLKDPEYRNRPELIVGKCVTISQPPDLQVGWKSDSLSVELKNDTYGISEKYFDDYKKFRESFLKEGDSSVTFMLDEKPVSWSDSTKLYLKLKRNDYCKTYFYWKEVYAKYPKEWEIARATFLDMKNGFAPHNLCSHVIVITSDDYVLLTKSTKSKIAYPEKWSASIEENLKDEDFSDGPFEPDPLMNCVIRGLDEELGLKLHTHYTPENINVATLFLEGHFNLNIAVACTVRLNINKDEARNIVINSPKVDIEFSTCDFIALEKVFDELFYPSHSMESYHPTSFYRMLIALLSSYGPNKVKVRLSQKYAKLMPNKPFQVTPLKRRP